MKKEFHLTSSGVEELKDELAKLIATVRLNHTTFTCNDPSSLRRQLGHTRNWLSSKMQTN